MAAVSSLKGIAPANPGLAGRASTLATELEVALLPGPPEQGLYLALGEQHLELRLAGANAPGAVRAEFLSGKAGYRARRVSPRQEAVARAVGLHQRRGLRVLDATAGLGRDGFVLAALGAEVELVERSPVIAALLHDGLARAAQELGEVVARMRLTVGDAVERMRQLPDAERPEVVYLDPMYPPDKGQAAAKKEMALFRLLLGPEPDPAPLLAAALECATRRVVVKRPRKAPPVAGRTPSHSIDGRSTRFDVYVLA